MRDFESSLQRISSKLLSAEATAKIVKPHRVFVGIACVTPLSLVKAIEHRKPIPHCDTRERLSMK
jgi:hypothetical protein